MITMKQIGIGTFFLKHGWVVAGLSTAAAVMLYLISFNSLKFGLATVDEMPSSVETAGWFALAVNLIELVALIWKFAKSVRIGEESKEDRSLNTIISFTMWVVFIGDFVAIFYASGDFRNLPTDVFGLVLAGCLRIIKSFLGAAGAEGFLILGMYMSWAWWSQRNQPIINHIDEEEPLPADFTRMSDFRQNQAVTPT